MLSVEFWCFLRIHSFETLLTVILKIFWLDPSNKPIFTPFLMSAYCKDSAFFTVLRWQRRTVYLLILYCNRFLSTFGFSETANVTVNSLNIIATIANNSSYKESNKWSSCKWYKRWTDGFIYCRWRWSWWISAYGKCF